MKSHIKKVLAFLLTLATLMSLFTGAISVSAMDLSKRYNVSWDHTLTDHDGNVFAWYGGIAADSNDFGHSYANSTHKMHDYTVKRQGLTGSNASWTYDEDYVYAFCIEPGVPLPNENEYSGSNNPTHGNKWERLSAHQQDLIMMALTYGYPNRSGISTSKDANACYAATQLIVWQCALNWRTSPTNLNDRSYAMSGHSGTMTAQLTSNKYLKAYYDAILSDMAKHGTRPSFAAGSASSAPAYELTKSGGQWKVTLTDTNHVLSDYYVADSAGMSVNISGSTMTITSSAPITSEKQIRLERRFPTTTMTTGFLTWSVPGKESANQDMVTGVDNAPVPAYLKLKVNTGHMKIVKTSEDGVIANIPFTVTGNGINQSVRTTSTGEILVENLTAGTYTVTEGTIDRYKPQESQTVTIIGGQTSAVTFNNVLKRGDLQVIKSSEDNYKPGHKFRLSGTSLSGLKVDEYAVTDDRGIATFKNVLISGPTPYVLEEVDTAVRYVVPEKQSAAVKWNEVTKATVTNALKKFTVNLAKKDSEKSKPQGDGSLANAQYGLFKGTTLVDTYYTDTAGAFTTKEYVCGDHWSLRELEPSEGYLLDPAIHHVGAEPGNFTAERNLVGMTVTEDIIKARLTLIKHSDNGDTQIEHPEAGATFSMYLTKSGSYAAADKDECDILTVDQYGLAANTKELPYGWYTIHQDTGWEGNEKIPDFEVFLGKDGEMYYYIINNAPITAKIRIEKHDAETGKIVKADGIGFEIYGPDGKKIVQHIDYPQPLDISTFYTVDGWLMLPEPLDYGKGYKLVEVQTVAPYFLGDPVFFDVDSSETVVTVVQKNSIQKGKIHFDKYGEVFGSVAESGGVYQPVYKVEGLAGCVIDVYSAEDLIINGDVKYKKDQLVSTVTTKKNGADTSLLYPGRYYYMERTAPYGMTSGQIVPKFIEIVYAGQTVKETLTTESVYNERQKAAVSLDKVMEQDGIFGIGMGGEILSVSFGLYAVEDLKAADGSIIPKDGLLEIVSVLENGSLTFNTDIPVGANLYIREISTDEHYLVSDQQFPVVFAYAGQDVALVEIKANDGSPIVNDMIRGKVEGVKIGEDGEGLAGALIGLFKPDETEFTEENALMTAESAEDGGFSFEDVPYGEWVCREIATPSKAYVLSDKSYPVTISEQDETVSIELENRLVRGSVRTTKVDAEYPGNKLSGAVFDVFADTNGNGEYDEGVDLLVGTPEEIETGVYQLDDLIYSGYFLHERTAPDKFLLDPNYYYFEILTDGEIVTVENQAGAGFINQPVTGELWLTKKDVSTGVLIPNCGIRIKDGNGNTVVEGRTDENGFISFTLRAGKYTYSEFDCPGYMLDEREFPFEITEDGQIVKVVMTNEKIPEPEIPDIPQTGDSSNVALWLALMGVSVTALVGLAITGKRKKAHDKNR